MKRAMMDKFQTYKKAKKQASHIVGIQRLLHQAYKKRNDMWTNEQGQPQRMLWPTTPKKPTNHIQYHEKQKKLKKAWQAQWRVAEKEEGIGAHLFIGNPSMSLNSPTQQNATEREQMNSPSPSIVDTTAPSIDNLCTQIESLMLDEREKVINCLHLAQKEPYSQLVWSTWQRKRWKGSTSPYKNQCTYMSSFTSHINKMKPQCFWTPVPQKTSFKNCMLNSWNYQSNASCIHDQYTMLTEHSIKTDTFIATPT